MRKILLYMTGKEDKMCRKNVKQRFFLSLLDRASS